MSKTAIVSIQRINGGIDTFQRQLSTGNVFTITAILVVLLAVLTQGAPQGVPQPTRADPTQVNFSTLCPNTFCIPVVGTDGQLHPLLLTGASTSSDGQNYFLSVPTVGPTGATGAQGLPGQAGAQGPAGPPGINTGNGTGATILTIVPVPGTVPGTWMLPAAPILGIQCIRNGVTQTNLPGYDYTLNGSTIASSRFFGGVP